MKLAILACLAAVAMAAPQLQQGLPVVQVLRDERQQDDNGNFNYALETDNGIYMAASGVQGSQGQINIEGSYRLPDNEGGFQEVRYVANEFGVQAQSPLLPTPHPLPAHVQELLRIAEEQRAAGITFE
ncbi:cuticle protein AM1159-like [Homarus americanus]|uniref:cuticle protein AM1159-like n=1 Tax=Homarus americanus TaxID=6706 RepID=UPI001C4805DA|nr:cuticle protein AM1159-like [Homarus americanus]